MPSLKIIRNNFYGRHGVATHYDGSVSQDDRAALLERLGYAQSQWFTFDSWIEYDRPVTALTPFSLKLMSGDFEGCKFYFENQGKEIEVKIQSGNTLYYSKRIPFTFDFPALFAALEDACKEAVALVTARPRFRHAFQDDGSYEKLSFKPGVGYLYEGNPVEICRIKLGDKFIGTIYEDKIDG